MLHLRLEKQNIRVVQVRSEEIQNFGSRRQLEMVMCLLRVKLSLIWKESLRSTPWLISFSLWGKMLNPIKYYSIEHFSDIPSTKHCNTGFEHEQRGRGTSIATEIPNSQTHRFSRRTPPRHFLWASDSRLHSLPSSDLSLVFLSKFRLRACQTASWCHFIFNPLHCRIWEIISFAPR